MQSNISRSCTRQDVAVAMAALSGLPKRVAPDAQVEFDGYVVALEGVAADVLAEAVKAVLRGALDHAFFPAPPELRKACNAIVERRAAEAERARRQERIREENATFAPIPQRSAAQRAHVAAAYDKFLEGYRERTEGESIDAIRAKYDPQLLASIPDRDTVPNWQRGVVGNFRRAVGDRGAPIARDL